MFSHTYDTCPLVVCDHEYCYFLPRFGLLHNTTHWGKIEGTRSLVLCLFSYSKHANGRIFFQVLLPFSPVRGELPHPHIPFPFQLPGFLASLLYLDVCSVSFLVFAPYLPISKLPLHSPFQQVN